MHETTAILSQYTVMIGAYLSYDDDTILRMEHPLEYFLVPKPPRPFILLACNDSDHMGVSCNISTSPCALLSPCLNQATCTANKTSPQGYLCRCPPAFQGGDCEIDTRPCKPDTCRNNGTLPLVTPWQGEISLFRDLFQHNSERVPMRMCRRMDEHALRDNGESLCECHMPEQRCLSAPVS